MIRHMLLDGAFESMQHALAEKYIKTTICSENEHIGEIECTNRTVKERCQGIHNTLPFKQLPGKMIAEMVYAAVFWSNAFHPNRDLLQNLSQRTIMTGRMIDYNSHCKHKFGAYLQTHKATDNSMRPRTIVAIALHPTGNEQGGHYYMSLESGHCINHLRVTDLPMLNEVITQVHVLVWRNPHGLIFRDHNNP